MSIKAARYRILLLGFLDNRWSAFLAGMTMTARATGVTQLSGEIADRSALQGLLNRILDLDLQLVSVQLLDADGVTPVECRHCLMCQASRGGHGDV